MRFRSIPRLRVDLRSSWLQAAALSTVLTTVLALALGCSSTPPPPPAPPASFAAPDVVYTVTDDLEVSVLAPGVWIHTSWRTFANGVRFPSHGLIVQEGEELVLVDTAWGLEPTEQLLAWIDETLGLPVARAVVTHFHDDRMGGSAALEERGIPFFGFELTRRLGAGEGVPLPQPLPGLRRGRGVAFGSMEVYYPGPAHTHDNVVVWIPKAAVLFGGCAVRPLTTQSTGNTADASLAEWPKSIRRLERRYGQLARIVVPSHGPPGGPELLAHTIEIFANLPDA